MTKPMNDLVIAEDLQGKYERYRMAWRVTEDAFALEACSLIERCSRAEQDNKVYEQRVAIYEEDSIRRSEQVDYQQIENQRLEQDNKALREQIERLNAPIGEREMHYGLERVMDAVKGTQHIHDGIRRMHLSHTSGEIWSLYRALGTLLIAGRKGD